MPQQAQTSEKKPILVAVPKTDESTEDWGRRFIRHFLTLDSFDKTERQAALEKVHTMLGSNGSSFAEVLHNSMGPSRNDHAQVVRANQELGDQLDAMKDYIGTLETKLARQSLPARFARAAKSLLHPNLEKLAYSGAAATMVTTYATTGKVLSTLFAGATAGIVLLGGGSMGGFSAAHLRSVGVGLALSLGSVVAMLAYKTIAENKLRDANPLPAMITAGELGPKTVIVDFPFSRHVSVITAAGKRDTVTYKGDDGAPSQKSCTTYWKKEQDAIGDAKNDLTLRTIDFTTRPYQQVGDCELVAAYRKAQLGRAGQLQAQLNN